MKTDNKDKREYALNSAIRKVKNKSGVLESRPFTCPECSEEFCDGRSCCDFSYDLYTRVVPPTPTVKKLPAPANGGGGKNGLNGGKKKIKSGKGDKKKSKKRTQSPEKKQKN